MIAWPQVTILICTYNRLTEIEQTVAALREHLTYSGKLQWMICDDSSPDDYHQRLTNNKILKPLKPAVISTLQNGGWAANVNNGLQAVDTELCFFIEDDYILQKPLNLDMGVALLETRKNIGMLRYRGTAGEHIVYHQFESDISAYCPDYQDGVGLPGRITYFQLDSGSPSLYLYSNGAHLKRTAFHQFYGLYPEGLRLGATEERYAHIVKDGMKRPNAPAIAILPEWVHMQFDHIGKSYQHTEFDRGNE